VAEEILFWPAVRRPTHVERQTVGARRVLLPPELDAGSFILFAHTVIRSHQRMCKRLNSFVASARLGGTSRHSLAGLVVDPRHFIFLCDLLTDSPGEPRPGTKYP